MSETKFTHKMLANLKPKSKPYEVRQGNGLGVRVTPKGNIRFIFIYSSNGKKRKISVEKKTFPTMTLQSANKEAEKYRKLVAEGNDPLVERQTENKSLTIAELAGDFIENYSKPKKRTWKEDQRILKKYFIPKLGQMKAKDVKRGMVKKVLDNLATKTPVQANRAFACIRKMFNYALEYDIIEVSPCYGLSRPGGSDNTKDRTLSDEEIKVFYESLEFFTCPPEVIRILRLMLLTGQRATEICKMHGKQIKEHWWTIPVIAAKNKKAHRVYLVDEALKIIGKREGLIFPANKPDTSILHHAASKAILKHFGRGWAGRNNTQESLEIVRFSPHDLRRTVTSKLTEIGFSSYIAGRVLNHESNKSVTDTHYNQYSYDKEKKQAMEAWNHRLNQIINEEDDDKIIQISTLS